MNVPPTIAYIFVRYPLLSQLFLRRELAALIAQGFRVHVHSLVPPPAADLPLALPGVPVDCFHRWELVKLLVAVPRELARDPSLLRDAWRLCREHRFTSIANFGATVWAVAFAFCRAHRLRQNPPQHFHGVWATGPATAAAVLSRLCGVPFSFGAQAHDIYRHGGDTFLDAKLRAAGFVHTTTETNVAYLRQRAGNANIVFARRGLDALPACPEQNRNTAREPVRLLSVGRLVEKKGHAFQLAACAALREQGMPFEARIVGDGPLRGALETRVRQLGLDGAVQLCGAQSPEQVTAHYRWADIFWHTGVIDAGGDRDGLPNVIPEAFAHGLAVICSQTAGATEAVLDEQTGLAVDVRDAAALAGAVRRLAADGALRQRLGANARRWVEEHFLAAHNNAVLASAFRRAIGGAEAAS